MTYGFLELAPRLMLSADTMVNTAAAAVTSGTVATRVSAVIDGGWVYELAAALDTLGS